MTNPKSKRSEWPAALAGLGAVVFLACFVRPDLSRQTDEKMYLDAMQGFLERGLEHPFSREPLFPLFLALLKTCGVDPERFLPLVQNLLFVAASFFFLRSLSAALNRPRALLLASLLCLVPTFLVPLNGAIYAESLTTTLVLTMLGALFRLGRIHGGSPAALPWLALALLCSALLGLTKGTFIYIHFLFAPLGIFWLGLGWLRARRNNPKPLKISLGAGLTLVAIGSYAGGQFWLKLQASRNGQPLEIYSRGGVVLYGRTEYARNFDFARDSAPFLLSALSVSAYRRVYGGEPTQYIFDAENTLGYEKLARDNLSDAELFQLGLRAIAENPFRQFAFCFYELSRFVLHHSSSGFAFLTLPVAGGVFHSTPVALLLKIFNLALYVAIPFQALRARRSGRGALGAWRNLPEDERGAVALYAFYALAYLAAYSFASTIVRMVYPIAPLLVVLNWQLACGGKSRQDSQ